MNKLYFFLLIASLLFATISLNAQDGWEGYEHLATPVQNYLVCKTKKSLLMDGKANEPEWGKVTWSNDFVDIEGHAKPKPLYRTKIKMLYDDLNLYLLAELEEPNIWATYDSHDMIIYHENDFEVFIDPDRDTHNYFEYEINARNTLLDLKMSMPYRNGGKANISWNSKGFQSAVSLEGTLNDPSDTDQKWTIEMKIPFADLEIQRPVKDGQTWKVNFSRVEWRIQPVDGKYEKIKNPVTQRAWPEYNWVWSAPGLINMHYPERWGIIHFSAREAGDKTVQFKAPEEKKAADHLWLVYYKQQDFKRKNNRYATSLKELEISPDTRALKMNMTATAQQFSVKAFLMDGSVLSIDEKGLFLTKNKDQ